MVSIELIKTTVSILLILDTIIVSHEFLRTLTKAIDGEIATSSLFSLLVLKTLTISTLLISPSLFMAVLMVIGRMYRDHEMSVLASAGMGTSRLVLGLAWVVIPVFFISSYMALVVMPWSEKKSQEYIMHDVGTHDIRGIKPGRFNEFNAGDVVLYAESLDENKDLKNIFVQSRDSNSISVVIAERGRLQTAENGDTFIVLNQGKRYQGSPGQVEYVISEYGEYAVRISGPEEISATIKREGTSTLQLLLSRTPKELAELQKRVAIPLGVLALAFLAVPLARTSPRQGAYGNVFSAFIIYIIYENSQKITQGMLMTGMIPEWGSYVIIYGSLIIITLILLAKNLGVRWLKHSFSIRRKT